MKISAYRSQTDSSLHLVKNAVCFAVIVLILGSCRVSLPENYDRKSLQEANYIENNKENYTLHLKGNIPAVQVRLQAIPKAINLDTKDSVLAFKQQQARPYIDIVSTGDTAVLSNRHIYFKNAVNFRDIGGLRTKDGKTVRWGKIFRSDNLSGLTSREFYKFDEMHIATVYDLRTDHEIKGKEDHLPVNVTYRHTPTVQDNEGEIAKLRAKVIGGKISKEQASEQTIMFYRDAVSVNVNSLREIIQQITASDEPVLYHCSAGKDRTGIVSALILSILNVDRQTIVNEYLLSNYYRRAKTEKMLGKAKLAKIIKPKMDLKAIEVFMTVDADFINGTFNVIDEKYGGINNFIQNQLGIDATERKQIVKKFTY